jgi:hypothetical protein
VLDSLREVWRHHPRIKMKDKNGPSFLGRSTGKSQTRGAETSLLSAGAQPFCRKCRNMSHLVESDRNMSEFVVNNTELSFF